MKIHEGNGCGSPLPGTDSATLPEQDFNTEVKNRFSIFPNPTSRELQLRMPDVSGETEGLVQVFNTTGQLLIEKRLTELSSKKSINVEQLPQGTYLIRYDDGTEAVTERFTIMRE